MSSALEDLRGTLNTFFSIGAALVANVVRWTNNAGVIEARNFDGSALAKVSAAAPTAGSHLTTKTYTDGVAAAGAPSATKTIKISIAFNSPSPAPALSPIPAGSIVTRCAANIITPFDGVGFAFEVGSIATPDLLMTPAQNDPTTATPDIETQFTPWILSDAPQVTITVAGGAAGAADVYIDFIPAPLP